MNFNDLLLKNDKTVQILDLITNGENVKINGLNNSRLSYYIGNIFSSLKNAVLLVTYDSVRMDQIYEDLLRLLPEEKIIVFPEIGVLPHEQIASDHRVLKNRVKVLQELIYGQAKKVVLTTGNAMMRCLMPAELFEKYSFALTLEQELNFSKLKENLSLLGYERVGMVEDPQQFSIRGGIIDIFPITSDKPYRIELFGDEIDSIRLFDVGTQRSIDNLERIIIPPAREIILHPGTVKAKLPIIKNDYQKAIKRLETMDRKDEAEYLSEKGNEILEKLEELNVFPGFEQFLPYYFNHLDSLFDYLKEEMTVFYDQTDKIEQRIRSYNREIQETEITLLEQGSIIPSYSENFLEVADFIEDSHNHHCVYFSDEFKKSSFASDYSDFSYETRGVEPFHGQLDMLVERLKELLNEKYSVVVTLNTENKARRIADYLQEEGLPAVYSENSVKADRVTVIEGSFSEGFIFDDYNLAVYTEKEVIGKPQRKKRKIQDIENGVKISSLNELKVGDHVVHENHGIGKYLGVKTLEVQDKHKDYLVIKYAGEDKLYVPTEQVNLVQKYIGADNRPPKLYKLGGNDWKKVKQKVQNSVKEMAIGLLELYAERETVKGYSFSEDTVWQKEFEDAFPYEETPDQMKAIQDVKSDMEDSTPMDRLLCGDVGYGKTEVAIRAAFKAAVEGKQTAFLVPTTILAQQHYNTFKERIDNFPITVDMISRFKTQREQKETLKKVANGEVDIIVGTHRLLSKDIVFNDLGLLIIDEEQRFGVTHKERIKDIKRNVDVLTLTATPIPRTLHMALVGVRDMSVIETPPEDRYPIRTYIREFNKELVKEVLRRELGRDGQVYFVHNRVEDIEEKASMIRDLLPDVRVAVAHGQMNEKRLEKLMVDFYNQKFDVLVCTTIIETGLDIPNVNTIIINRAENMGLAQLYQLRGRVGRSNRIAYAYLLYEKDRVLPEVAEKRLRAIKEFTNLGSGFKIAMRDLEIRGAGNLLGAEQHGHIASIGFSLYCKLLETAIEELKGKEDDEKVEVEIDLKVDAYIPEEYISDSKQKIEIYKKIKMIKNEEEISDIIDELVDRFGDPPVEVMNLINISRLSIKAQKLGIEKIGKKKDWVNCYFKDIKGLKGKAIVDLVDKYKRKLRIRSAKKPVIGIKTGDKTPFKLVEKVLTNLLEIISNS